MNKKKKKKRKKTDDVMKRHEVKVPWSGKIIESFVGNGLSSDPS